MKQQRREGANTRVWIITEGAYYTSRPGIESVHQTKAGAERYCRDAGFKFSAEQGFFCNESSSLYRVIEPYTVVEHTKKSQTNEG